VEPRTNANDPENVAGHRIEEDAEGHRLEATGHAAPDAAVRTVLGRQSAKGGKAAEHGGDHPGDRAAPVIGVEAPNLFEGPGWHRDEPRADDTAAAVVLVRALRPRDLDCGRRGEKEEQGDSNGDGASREVSVGHDRPPVHQRVKEACITSSQRRGRMSPALKRLRPRDHLLDRRGD
jgi:hypothetical protein